MSAPAPNFTSVEFGVITPITSSSLPISSSSLPTTFTVTGANGTTISIPITWGTHAHPISDLNYYTFSGATGYDGHFTIDVTDIPTGPLMNSIPLDPTSVIGIVSTITSTATSTATQQAYTPIPIHYGNNVGLVDYYQLNSGVTYNELLTNLPTPAPA